MFRALVCLVIVVGVVESTTAAPPKKKTKGQAKSLSAGDEVIFKLIGDETNGRPKSEKVGLVRDGSLLLPALVKDEAVFGLNGNPANTEAKVQYQNVLGVGDRAGMDELVEKGTVFRLGSGTRLSVLYVVRLDPHRDSLGRYTETAHVPTLYFVIPASKPDGIVGVRILDGPNKGKLCEVPLRNLSGAPAPTETKP